MKRLIPLLAILVVLGVIASVKFTGGCNGGGGSAGTTRTRPRMAQRHVYSGPSTQQTAAREWPRWLGPFGDNISRETNLADEWPKGGPKQRWSAEVGIGYASPVAAGGRVYLFSMSGDSSRETLTCFDADS